MSSLAITSDDMHIVSGDYKTIRIWGLHDKRLKATLVGHTSYVTWLAVTSDSKCIMSHSYCDKIRIWNLQEARQELEFQTEDLNCIVATRDGKYIASCCFSDIIVRILIVNGGKWLDSLEGHTGAITSIVISNDDKNLYTSARDWTVRIWDLGTFSNCSIVLTYNSYFIERLSITNDNEHFIFLTIWLVLRPG